MLNYNSRFASAVLLATTGAVLSCSIAAQEVPKQIQPPAAEQLLLRVHAKGDQVYTCKADGAQFTWTLKAPDAQLFDKDGKPFGKHFAGPSWEATDGSRVTGKVLSRATSIQRLNTKGGKAPASGCDASHTAQEVRVPYSADYLFYAPK